MSKEDLQKADEIRKTIRPLYETVRDSDGTPISVYSQDDMNSMFEAGMRYALEKLSKEISNYARTYKGQ